MANARKVAVDALYRVDKENAYSNIVFGSEVKKQHLDANETAFCAALFYGTLDRLITLDFIISQFLKNPINKIKPYTLQCLRIGAYQIIYMDKVPNFAAVSETVNLVKHSKEKAGAGFVNAVLKNISKGYNLPQDDSPESLSVRYSCPVWLVKSFIGDYGSEKTVDILKESLNTPPIYLRVNTTKYSVAQVFESLQKQGVSANNVDGYDSLSLSSGFAVESSYEYNSGMFYVQDLSSQIAVKTLDPKPNKRLLDLCAAPGGKTFTAAQLMNDTGEIISCDIYDERTELIKSGAKRLGLLSVKTVVNNATVYNPELFDFDYVLCDVPCSGFGIIRRKPDIKYKPCDDYVELSKTQLAILTTAAEYLKAGGSMVYSTCTLHKLENEDVVYAFLKSHTDFVLESIQTYMPNFFGGDGFFVAKIKRKD